jgi:hypothetical protein
LSVFPHLNFSYRLLQSVSWLDTDKESLPCPAQRTVFPACDVRALQMSYKIAISVSFLFRTADLTQNTETRQKVHPVPFPICTAAMAVKAMFKYAYCGSFYCESYHHSQSFLNRTNKPPFLNVIRSSQLYLLHAALLTNTGTTTWAGNAYLFLLSCPRAEQLYRVDGLHPPRPTVTSVELRDMIRQTPCIQIHRPVGFNISYASFISVPLLANLVSAFSTCS